ncbi:related to beta-1,3 exoglucanase precursor [Rhynchosporium secalis]|uniref:Related to beta-1,3 exoglucanase n=1 Tax=Rhynchosporium secalis TaxID=38038 RepID=A0A1E1MLF1_RHYSE|nr:related to beta-1,3 exoglucanase precursor [Rhynchosporium secalis]
MLSYAAPSQRVFLSILLLFSSTPTLTNAQSASQTITSGTSINAKIFPGDKNYAYAGCYAETTQNNVTNNLRALTAGKTESLETMTVQTCLDYCKKDNYEFAGLEYTKECWCAHSLSSAAQKLDDGACDLACTGNTTQVCGGALKLSVYTATKASKKGAAGKVGQVAPVGSILALGIAMGFLLCLA